MLDNATLIKNRLKELEITQSELAKLVNVSDVYIHYIITGKRKGINILEKIESILSIKLNR